MNSGGFGSFGSPSGFNTNNNLFSSSTQNTAQNTFKPGGLFGASTTSNPSPLGGGTSTQSTGLFASASSTTPFSFASGGTTGAVVGQTQTGTGHVKFAAPSGQDTISKNGATQTINTNHQCLTAMKEYENKSLEELRLEDYQANRKFPTQTGFGGGGGLFSSATPAGTTSAFGGTNSLFNSSAIQPAKPTMFGSATQPTTGTTSLFGQSTLGAGTQNKSFFGGATTTTTPAATPFSAFGTQTNSFGQTTTQPAQSTGLFGNLGQTSTTTGGGLFGSTANTSGTGGSLFQSASTANKPIFSGFGQSATTTATSSTPQFNFGQTGTTPAATTTTTTPSLFGQSTLTQSPLSANRGSTFGSSTLGGFGTTAQTTTGFGTSTTGTTQPTTSIFGTTTPAKTTFGTGLGGTTTGGFGGFGTSTTGSTPANTSGGLFGGFTAQAQPGSTTTTTTTASPFGSTLGTSTFGSGTTTGGGLFGSSQTTNQQASGTTGGGLFGTQPSTGFGTGSTLGTGFGTTTTTTQPSIFGGGGTTSTTTPSLFGGLTSGQQTGQLGVGLTGSTGGLTLGGSGTSGLGSFNLSSAPGTTSTGGFGGFQLGGSSNAQQQSQLQQQQQQQQFLQQQQQQQNQPLVQQQLLALSNSPYGTSSLLKNTLQDLSKREEVLKPLSPIAQRPYILEATSPPKVTTIAPSASSLTSDMKGGLSQPVKITPKVLTNISLNRSSNLFEGLEEEETPCFYPRKNIKKLLFRPSTEGSTSRRSSTTGSSVINGDKKMTPGGGGFNVGDDSTMIKFGSGGGPAYGSFTNAHITTDSTNVSDDGINNGDNQSEISVGHHTPHPANIQLERPGYFTIPSMQDLAQMTNAKGECYAENFSIGRVDYGCITFPGVTILANMNLDEIVHIRRKEVHVYPDDSKKPPVGEGLNKPAEITLHRIWPTEKLSKMPITDPQRIIELGYNKKIERATIEMGAQFIDYDPVTGSWTFKVKHFSKYGLNDSDDEDDDNNINTHRVPNLNNLNSNNMKFGKVKQLDLTGGKQLMAAAAATADVMAESASDNEAIRKEKEMIDKQLKLIEMRRLELMHARKGSIGSNLNSITNQQWEILNEYCAPAAGGGAQPKPSSKYEDASNLHLQLSSDEDERDDDDDDRLTVDGDERATSRRPKNNNIRKALNLDADNETDDNGELIDDNKENKTGLYPDLKEFKKSLRKSNRVKEQSAKDKLYPDLDRLHADKEQPYGLSYEMDDREELKLKREELIADDQQMMDDLPFISNNDRLLGNFRESRRIADAFFNDDDEQGSGLYSRNIGDDSSTKYTGFNQKPITFGLLKRNFGGISTLNQENKLTIGGEPGALLSTSLKGDQFHGESKVTKLTTYSLGGGSVPSSSSTQLKIVGPIVLKPKLWNRVWVQKPLKATPLNDLTDESRQSATNELMKTLSLAGDQQTVPSSSRMVMLKDSIANDMQMCVVDAGLFNARRFRVNWSLNPSACTYGYLTGLSARNGALPFASAVQLANFECCLLANSTPDEAKLAKIKDNCEAYLKIQLDLSELVQFKQLGAQRLKLKLPHFRTKLGNELIKRCCECTQQIRNNIVGDHPDADNVEHMKIVWNLCQSLWGDIADSYKSNSNDSALSEYEKEQIRKRLLGEWLVDVSSHKIEKECRLLKYNKNKDNYLSAIFSLLTGNRILDACNLAIENQDFRLALLLCQSSGGNDDVRALVRKQLNEWSQSEADKFINMDRLKLYVLIAGNLIYNSANIKEDVINVCENLDWKRQFAINLWYQSLPINSISDAVEQYETCVRDEISNKPLPTYLEDSVNVNVVNESAIGSDSYKSNQGFKTGSSISVTKKSNELYDTCYHLIKLYCASTYSVEDIVSPLNHTSNQLDYRLSWHLAMALYALQYNQVSSACLETLHDSYATQLQSVGLWQWAVFVLMHIENDHRRETYVKTYLSKYVTSSSDLTDKEIFLIEKLHVPIEWIYEYKALRAKYEHSYENQFKLLIKARKWNEAHLVLIELLAPDMFIKQNYKTLYEYLSTLNKEKEFINKWAIGGQVYLDFIKLNQMADVLFNFSIEDPNEKGINEEIYDEIHNQLMSLSARVKEFEAKSSKKLLCSLNISKLLLKFFNVFSELITSGGEHCDSAALNEEDIDDDQKLPEPKEKQLTKTIVERSIQQTESVPDHDLIRTMYLKKSKYTHEHLMSKTRY